MSGPKCPQCKKSIAAGAARVREDISERPSFLPFCSERCKMADLGKWLGGAYAIPGRPLDPSEIVDTDEN